MKVKKQFKTLKDGLSPEGIQPNFPNKHLFKFKFLFKYYYNYHTYNKHNHYRAKDIINAEIISNIAHNSWCNHKNTINSDRYNCNSNCTIYSFNGC